MQLINIDSLIIMAVKHPEIKRLCAKNVPVYLLQLELERYKVCLESVYYKDLYQVRKLK